MKGRNIQDSLRCTLDIIEYTKCTHKPCLIMTIDFEKCFDKIEHKSIFSALEYFNFGEIFIKWLHFFFTGLTIQMQNFGFLSEPLVKTRGSNQGCNYSPFCYLLCGGIMARKIKQNPLIKRIEIQDMTCLLSQFADSTTLFLEFDRVSLEAVIETLDIISCNTGLTINYDKTSIYRTGSLANSNAKLYTTKKFNWVNEDFDMLGLTISNDSKNTCIKNFENTIDKLYERIASWQN